MGASRFPGGPRGFSWGTLVDEDETTEEEGSGFSDDEVAAIKEGDEDKTIKEDSNATEAAVSLIDESDKTEDEVATEEDEEEDKAFEKDDGQRCGRGSRGRRARCTGPGRRVYRKNFFARGHRRPSPPATNESLRAGRQSAQRG